MRRPYVIKGIELGHACYCCGGDGFVEVPDDKTGDYKAVECGERDGKGMHVSRDGEILVAFIRKALK